jgi:pimeloyl-ACP methyl ester carboxylesterase
VPILGAVLRRQTVGAHQPAKRWRATADERWQSVEVPVGDSSLTGLFGRAETGEPTAGVLLVHPMDPRGKGYFLGQKQPAFIREAGYDTFVIDLNGFAESDFVDFRYDQDVAAAMTAFRERSAATEFGAIGVSLGGAALLSALGNDVSLRSLVLDSVFASALDFWSQADERAYYLLKAAGRLWPTLLKRLTPVDQLDGTGDLDSALLVYGTDDELTPPPVGHQLRTASPLDADRCPIVTVEGASHARAYLAATERYRSSVLGTFADAFDLRETSSLSR